MFAQRFHLQVARFRNFHDAAVAAAAAVTDVVDDDDDDDDDDDYVSSGLSVLRTRCSLFRHGTASHQFSSGGKTAIRHSPFH